MSKSIILLIVGTLGLAGIVYYFKPEWFGKPTSKEAEKPAEKPIVLTQEEADKLAMEIWGLEEWKYSTRYAPNKLNKELEQRKKLKAAGYMLIGTHKCPPGVSSPSGCPHLAAVKFDDKFKITKTLTQAEADILAASVETIEGYEWKGGVKVKALNSAVNERALLTSAGYILFYQYPSGAIAERKLGNGTIVPFQAAKPAKLLAEPNPFI